MSGHLSDKSLYIDFKIEFNKFEKFIDYWSSRYSYPLEEKYIGNVGRPLTKESRLALFEWKNGGTISKKKLASIVENYPLRSPDRAAQRYLDHRNSGGAIWNIFYLHCMDPDEWPIFDQHTFRAMQFLRTGKIIEISSSNKRKYECYQKEYKPFVKIRLKSFDSRIVDRALFTFGRFLKAATPFF